MSREDRKDPTAEEATSAVEEVEVRGHIVDSLLLPKILDRILQMGGTFEIRECRIGSRRVDPSYARIAVRAATAGELDEILGDLVEHGASPVNPEDARIVPADIAGAFPEGFYSTTNQRTQVRLGGPLGRRGRPGDGLRDRRRCRGQDGPLRGDDRRDARHADRRRPRGGPGRAARTAPRIDPVRVHGVERLQREAQGGQPPGGRRRRSGRPGPRGRRSCSSAARRSSTPARPGTSPG